MPDLDLIKQGEQGVRDRRGQRAVTYPDRPASAPEALKRTVLPLWKEIRDQPTAAATSQDRYLGRTIAERT